MSTNDEIINKLTEIERQLESQERIAFRRFHWSLSIAFIALGLGAALADSKFPRPFSRVISESIGGAPNNSSRLRLRFDVLRSIFDAVEKERPREAKTLEFARTFLHELENRGVKQVFLEELMAQGLELVRGILSRCHPPTGGPTLI